MRSSSTGSASGGSPAAGRTHSRAPPSFPSACLRSRASPRSRRTVRRASTGRKAWAKTTPDDLRTQWASLLSDVDAAVATAELAAFLLANTNDALAPGVDGWVDDDLAFVAPWGFDVADIGIPVLLLHGPHDRFVPLSPGRWLAGRIPGVDARLGGEDGHLTLIEHRVPE